MGITISVNPDLLVDDDPQEDAPALPEGVLWLKDLPLDDKGRPIMPPGRVELFRADGRVFTLPERVNPKIAFRYLRAVRQNSDQIVSTANMLYDILGEGTIDALAEFDLTDEEYEAVMKAVEKYSMGAVSKILGN